MQELQVGDLYALAALRSEGVEPIRTAGDGRRVSWVFEETPELRETLGAYYRGRLSVDALRFGELVRSAKAEAMHLRGAPA